MKKKELSTKLYLKKKRVASLDAKIVKGGTGNTGDCVPPTLGCVTNNCGTSNCGATNETCLTDAALSCTPRGCGNTLFNC